MTYKENLNILTETENNNPLFYLWQAIIAREMKIFASKLNDDEFERYCDMAYNVFQQTEYNSIDNIVFAVFETKAESEQSAIEYLNNM